jgi:hypothetical protein
MKYTEILMFLASLHWHSAVFMTIENGCNKWGLSRQNNYSSTDEDVQADERELNSSGNSIRYCAMHQTDYGLVVRKDAVRRVSVVLDPEVYRLD